MQIEYIQNDDAYDTDTDTPNSLPGVTYVSYGYTVTIKQLLFGLKINEN